MAFQRELRANENRAQIISSTGLETLHFKIQWDHEDGEVVVVVVLGKIWWLLKCQ